MTSTKGKAAYLIIHRKEQGTFRDESFRELSAARNVQKLRGHPIIVSQIMLSGFYKMCFVGKIAGPCHSKNSGQFKTD